MSRKNNDEQVINYMNTIKKSNELSMARLNQGLTLNQMQLLAFAIFCTQQSNKTEFRKYEFQKKFELTKYNTKDAYEDTQRISTLQFSAQDLENDRFSFTNVFGSIKYDKGFFTFNWNEEMLPHILEMKEKYVMMDLTVTSNFKSGFSWILYEYLKAHYGYWHKRISKEGLMKLFSVENRKTYQSSTAQFKRAVLDIAISEINKYTELRVWYTQEKVGNKIIGFTLHWSTGGQVAAATEKQVTLLREVHDEVERNLFEYMSLKDMSDVEKARESILKVKEINQQVDEKLSSSKAKDLISEIKELYEGLQILLENDGRKRGSSVYYNWIDENEDNNEL